MPDEGKKYDQGKPRWELLPFDAVALIVKVLTFGATKYTDRNWENGILYSRVFGAAQRHLTTWFQSESKDQETGLSHLAHAACCILFLMAYENRGMIQYDDRPKKEENV